MYAACVGSRYLMDMSSLFFQVLGKPATLCVSQIACVIQQSSCPLLTQSPTYVTDVCLLVQATVEVVGEEAAYQEATSLPGSFHLRVTCSAPATHTPSVSAEKKNAKASSTKAAASVERVRRGSAEPASDHQRLAKRRGGWRTVCHCSSPHPLSRCRTALRSCSLPLVTLPR